MLKKVFFASLLLLSGTSAIAQMPSMAGKAVANETAAQVVSVKTPSVNMAAPTQNSTQVFMELDNNGMTTHKLIAAYSPVANLIQLHKTFQKDGERYMQQVPMIAVKPHHEQDLKQGGFHIMLMGLKQSLKAGQQVTVTLLFEDGSYLNLNVPVV